MAAAESANRILGDYVRVFPFDKMIPGMLSPEVPDTLEGGRPCNY